MNKTTSAIVSAAVTGLFLGSTLIFSSCHSSSPSTSSQAAMEKHACAKLNTCKSQGGCKTGDQGCGGKNTCKAKGGCATADKHGCAKQNACKGQGGCKTGDQGCGGKNTCKAKGGCAVPIKH